MNGDSKLAPEDQMAIVLRKIFFYLEFLNLFLKQSTNQASAHPKLEYLFEKPEFTESLFALLDLSTIITKNRGINYQKSMSNDFAKLKALVANLGTEVTGYDYKANKEAFSAKNALKVGTRLEKGRFLYFKYHENVGAVSFCNEYDQLPEAAAVMNFECDDTICQNAQACQNQVKRFVRSVLQGIAKRRSAARLSQTSSEETSLKLFDFAYEIGRKQVVECLSFIDEGLERLKEIESHAKFDEEAAKIFDKVMFDVISGLF